MDYAFTHQGKAYTPNGTKIEADQADAHNAAIEAAELEAWEAEPDQFCGYITRDKESGRYRLTTWRGVILGAVISSSHSRNNLTGSKMHHVRVRGTNGAEYHGKYGSDWGDLVKLTKCK